MSLRLAQSAPDANHFADHPVSRLRYARRSRVASAARAVREPASAITSGDDQPEYPQSESFAPVERGPDYATSLARAEAEDVALVKLAASRLAVALREVSMLLQGDRGARKSDALARCTAKGWIKVHGDAFAALQTFLVTPEGYRAAGLRVPPFMS